MYKKSNDLPEDNYPFAQIEQICDKIKETINITQEAQERRKSGKAYKLIETVIRSLLNKYLFRNNPTV